MEEDLGPPIKSSYLQQSPVKKQIDALKVAVDEAQKKIDYAIVHNPDLQKAIRIVESFLRKTGRVCYGGQAINANLPTELKFYDEDYELPDYDFFTPSEKQDVSELVKMLEKEGFTDINEKPGIHDGTRKIFVNYVAIADITYIDSEIYKQFYKHSVNVAGIRFCNPDILRMNMYLELSRPLGQVERWEKVFERLLLLNKAHPINTCGEKRIEKRNIDPFYREKVVQFMISEKRVLAGAEVGFVYRRFENEKASMDWILYSGGTILLFSPDIEQDAETIIDTVGVKGTQIIRKPGFANIFPNRILIRKNRQPLVYLIQEDACTSYNEIKLRKSGTIRIASMDSLITLYLQLGLLTKDEIFLGIPVLCLAQRFIELVDRIRKAPVGKFPAFSLQCSGHQISFMSLQRERQKRANAVKKAKEAKPKANTRKFEAPRNQKRRHSTHKRKHAQGRKHAKGRKQMGSRSH